MINLARRLLKGAQAWRGGRVTAISGHSTSTQPDSGNDVAVDSAGNFFLCGDTDAGNDNGWVAKFDATMTLAWQRKQSYTAKLLTWNIGVDSSDNVYALGNGFVTAVPLLPSLFKYNSAGTLQWQRELTAAEDGNIFGMVVNSSGDSFFVLAITATTPYTLIAKYNSSGTLQWQRKLSSTYRCYAQGIAFASDGGVIVVGSFYDGANAVANDRGWVVKYDTSGAIQWQYKIHWAAQGQWRCVAVDSVTGDIFIGGNYSAAAVITGVITKLNSSGTHQWSRRHPTTGTAIAKMAVDPATGYVYGHISASTVVSIGCWDASGTLLWERYITADTGARINAGSLIVANNELLVACTANHTGASQGNDAVLLRMPLTGGAATTCGYLATTIPSATSYTTPAAPTNVAAGLTDAAGASTDAAGTATDAAGTMTFTNYTN